MNPDPDLFLILVAVVVSVIGGPISWALARRIGASRPAPSPAALPAEMDRRLERIEHAVDAIAVEMERVSEGQRFTTKLLAERSAPAAPAGAPAAADRAR